MELDVIEDDFEDLITPILSKEEEKKLSRFKHIKEILDEFLSGQKELREFEKELKKYKKDMMPGVVGET